MSNRSLIEFNHDHCPHDEEGVRDMGRMLRDYMRSGNAADLPKAATLLQMRHHSDPAPVGWVPPQDRQSGYKCLGWMRGDWTIVYWDAQPHNKMPRPFWHSYAWGATLSRKEQPTHFLPMPPAPAPQPRADWRTEARVICGDEAAP